MSGVVKIKCPKCGAVMNVKNVPGIESKLVKCPSCKEINPFINYRVMNGNGENPTIYGKDDRTHYGNNEKTQYTTGYEKTKLNTNLNALIGELKMPDGKLIPLKLGNNIIGRAAASSKATIQIPTDPAHKRLSREHIVINVVKDSNSGYIHYASLYKKEVNTTKVNDAVLEAGDKIKLADGDKIYLPDIVVTFELPDEDKTSLK